MLKFKISNKKIYLILSQLQIIKINRLTIL